MNKFILPLICIFISAPVTAETVYKKTNPDGSVTFTDQQSTDSKEVEIRKPTSFAPPRLPRLDLPTKKLKPNYNYVVVINSPSHDTSIINKPDVVVSVSVSPDIGEYGHQLRYQLAGESIVSKNTSETFPNVPRGTHNLSVSVVDAGGNVVSPAVSRTFHMKRFFIKPAPPPRPTPKAP